MNYDLTKITDDKKIKTENKSLDVMETKASELVIKSNETEVIGMDMTEQANIIKKILDGKRKEYTAPAKAFTDKVNELLMPGVKKANSISNILRAKLSAYRMAQEKKMKKETIEITRVKVTETAKVQYTKRYTHEIINPKDIPREYLCIDTAEITRAIRAGVRKIKGVRIFEKAIPNFR